MKVKFELDISEELFDSIYKNSLDDNFKVKMHDLLAGKEGIIEGITKDIPFNNIYGGGMRPIGIERYNPTGELRIRILDC